MKRRNILIGLAIAVSSCLLGGGLSIFNVTAETATGNSVSQYMFVGSSISYGHTLKHSMVDMLSEDYLMASYTVGADTQTEVYMRKTAELSDENKDGFGGTYVYDYDTVVLDGNGNGTFNGFAFTYTVENNSVKLAGAQNGIQAFVGEYYEGDIAYKFCENGDSLSDANPRYTTDGIIDLTVNDNLDLPGVSRRSYVGLMELAVQEHADKDIDVFFMQLSLNDVWQFTEPYSSSNHKYVQFGEIVDDQWTGFDTATSFGAMEWIISKAKETWDCEIVLYSCPMSTDDWNTFVGLGKEYDLMANNTRYAQMRTGLLKAAEKWDCQVIDMWGDLEVNETLRNDYERYYIDGTHFTTKGYERVVYQEFRQHLDGKNTSSGGSEKEKEYIDDEYLMSAAELAATSRWRTDAWIQSGAAAAVNATLVNNTDYVTVTAANGDSQLWYYNNYGGIKNKTSIEVTYRVASTVTATKLRVRSFIGGAANSVAEITLTKNGQWQTATVTFDDLNNEEVTQIRIDPLAGGINGDAIDIQSVKFLGRIELEELAVCGRFNQNVTHDYWFGEYNGVATDGTNSKLNGYTLSVSKPTDLTITRGWLIVKSDDGSVGVSKYQYKVGNGEWTDIEGGISERNMWFLDTATHGYILNGQYSRATAGVEGLTIPTSTLPKGEYVIRLRALTTNYKTVTMTWRYIYTPHELVYTAGVEATCTLDGAREHWYCTECETYFLDEECTIATTFGGLKIKAQGHQTGEWIVGKEATDAEAGERHKHCSVCDSDVYSESIPAINPPDSSSGSSSSSGEDSESSSESSDMSNVEDEGCAGLSGASALIAAFAIGVGLLFKKKRDE